MKLFKEYLTEQKEKIKIFILTEYAETEKDGLSETSSRIKEECEKKNVECKVIFVKNSYYIENDKEKENVYLGYIDPESNKKDIIKIDPNSDIVIVRKAASQTEKGLSLISVLESKNVFIINSRKTIELCNNKLNTTIATEKAGIRNPKTIILSECDRNVLYNIMDKFNKNKYPVVLKTILGEHGIGVMIIESFESLYSVLQTVWSKKIQVVVQEYIESKYDIRVIVINGKAIAAMKRIKMEGEFRTNAAQGSTVKNHKLTPEQEEMALQSTDAVYGYWIGCDLIMDKRDNLYLLEVNASAGTEGIEKASGKNIVGELIDTILDKSNWKRNNIEVGYQEHIYIYSKNSDKWIKMVAKLDTGNGITSSIHAENVKEIGDNVKFELDGHKFKEKVFKKYKVHLGKQEEFTEKRISVLLDIKIGNRKLEDVEFSLTSRKGTIKELEPVLIGRSVINKFGFVINSGESFLVDF